MYHSVDSRPATGESNVTLHVRELPRYVQGNEGESFVTCCLSSR